MADTVCPLDLARLVLGRSEESLRLNVVRVDFVEFGVSAVASFGIGRARAGIRGSGMRGLHRAVPFVRGQQPDRAPRISR